MLDPQIPSGLGHKEVALKLPIPEVFGHDLLGLGARKAHLNPTHALSYFV